MSNTQSLNIPKNPPSLTIYIPYTPPVAKTFHILSNPIQLFQTNLHIKIPYIQPHQPDETNALAQQLPKIT
ncbi:hypothetical protein, partial [Staphylococcus aureus]|uniref:hypothetical protein n=1 Tax=Staphylococcus aureus TaxID=1280 RepID=UPI0021B2BC8A